MVYSYYRRCRREFVDLTSIQISDESWKRVQGEFKLGSTSATKRRVHFLYDLGLDRSKWELVREIRFAQLYDLQYHQYSGKFSNVQNFEIWVI